MLRNIFMRILKNLELQLFFKKNFNYLNLSINTNEDFNFVRKIIYKSKNKDIGIEKLLTLSEKLRNEKKTFYRGF